MVCAKPELLLAFISLHVQHETLKSNEPYRAALTRHSSFSLCLTGYNAITPIPQLDTGETHCLINHTFPDEAGSVGLHGVSSTSSVSKRIGLFGMHQRRLNKSSLVPGEMPSVRDPTWAGFQGSGMRPGAPADMTSSMILTVQQCYSRSTASCNY